MNTELKDAIEATSAKIGMKPEDMATIMSYETGGTFDPWQKGPTTQWGVHRGLIQWGEPQRAKYGVTENSSVAEQVDAAGRYWQDAGFKPGMSLLQAYAAVNAGNVNNINASDANNGGAPGTVLDKVNNQMEDHKRKAAELLGGIYTPSVGAKYTADTEVYIPPTQDIAGVPRVEDKDIPQAPSLWQQQKDAFSNTTLSMILNANPYRADPNWQKPNADQIEADLKTANLDPERYAHYLGGSTSQAGYMKTIQDAQQDRDRLQRLSQAGLTGAVLDFVNQTLDPVNLAIDVGVSAVAPEVTVAKYGVRVSRVMSAALAGGASGLATSAVRYGYDPNGTASDLAMGMVVGAGVGAIVGRLAGSKNTSQEAMRLQKLGQDVIADHEGVPVAARVSRGSVGAARVQTNSFVDQADDALQMLEHADVAKGAMTGVRGDLSAVVDKSSNPAARMLGGVLTPDPVGRIGANINGRAASEEASLLEQEFMGKFITTWRPQKAAWLDGQKGRTSAEFNEQVFKYVHDKRITRGDVYDKEVQIAGDNWIKIRKEQLKLQKNPLEREGGTARPVEGAAKTNESDHYVPHEWDAYGIHMADQHFEDGTMHELIKGSMRKAHEMTPEEDLDILAGGFLRSLKSRGAGVDHNDFLARVSGDDLEDAMAALVESNGLTREQAGQVMKNLKAKQTSVKSDSGNATPFKRRALIDTGYVLPYRPVVRETGVAHDADLSISDFLNKNMEYLNSKYTKRASGNIAMARVKMAFDGGVIQDGITSKKEFATLLDRIAKKGADSGQSAQEIATDRKRLQYAYDMIMGTKTYEFNSTNAGWTLRMLRKINFTRMMNQVGLAQLPELGNIVGSVGLKAAVQQMPWLRRVINQSGKSALKDGLGDDIESVFGSGLEHWTRSADERHNELLDMIRGTSGGTWQQKTSALLDKANHLTSKISGMEGIDMMSKRWAYKAIVQKFANAAVGKAKFNAKRLADMGLDGDMAKRVYAELKNPANVSRYGTKVTGLKLDTWADKEAAEAFRRAVYRKSSEVIQRNDVGSMYMWMGHPIAQTLMQFRTFMVASYAKQSLKALHMRDPEAMMSASLAMTIGALVYEAQVRGQAVGRSDREKFLADRLKTEKVVEAAFAKAGVSSVLPMLVDTVIPRLGYKPLFSYNRTTGQASDLLLGNPASGLYDDIGQALGASRGLLSGNMSQEEARAMNKLLPFNNAFGYLQAFNYGISGLRERTPSSRKKLVGLFGD